VTIDLLDPDLHASGRAIDALARMRAEAPVAWTPGRRGPGYWSVTGHAELCAAARDAASFSSWWGTRPEVRRPEGAPRPLHNLDPPAHRALRMVAERTLAALPRPEPIAGAHVRAFAAGGGGDAVRALAEPVPAALFASWMGLPESDASALARLVVEVHQAGAALLDSMRDDPERPALVARARAATEAIGAYFREAIARARHGALALLRDLPLDEAVMLAALLVEAGLPTLTDAIGSALADLAERPELVRYAQSAAPRDRAILVEELVRRASPIVQFARRARHDTTLGGVRIAAGQQIVLWFLAANRDPRVFSDPDGLVADRAPNPHVAFGFGPHACLGARFARGVLDAVVVAWCAHVGPNATVRAAERRRSSYLRGFERLDLAMEC
jgi:cytochrome P450